MDLVADRPRYNVGDTAVVLVAAPFTGAEAWVTVERERVIEQRRLKITGGSTALRFPITEAFVPNAFVSVIMVRGRSAKPGPLDDPGLYRRAHLSPSDLPIPDLTSNRPSAGSARR